MIEIPANRHIYHVNPAHIVSIHAENRNEGYTPVASTVVVDGRRLDSFFQSFEERDAFVVYVTENVPT